MAGKENFIKGKTKEVFDWAAEATKKADKFLIALGTGVFLFVNSAVGAAIVIGSAITVIPANEVQKWAQKR